MKQLVCEMCGGVDLVKDGGVFVCQTCGTKYSVEEAKKMMVEGTVDVTGTVKVDRTSEVDNIIKNADRTFDDGNHKEAFDLYSQALNIEPDNPHAILYRAVSSAWQSSVKDCRIGEINRAMERAFELKHNQLGDTLEYFNFVTDAINKSAPCLNAIANMYINYFNKANPRTGLSISLAVMTVDLAAEVKSTLENGTSNCCVVSQNIATYALDGVVDYSESTDGYWAGIETVLKNAKVYRSNAGMSSDSSIDRKLDDVKKAKDKAKVQREEHAAKVREQEAKEKAEKRDAYWNEHASEKAELEAEKASLEARSEAIKAQVDEINKQRTSDVNELRKIRDAKVPEEIECDKQRELIRELENQRNKCGIFKGKEKKEIQERIDQENIRLEEMRKNAQTAADKHKADINVQISVIQQTGQDVIDEFNKLKARIQEIVMELTKDR